MHFDLHSHSTASDGTLSPAALVQRAQAQGVDALGLTDHDTTSGLDEAQRAAEAAGILLVPGVEISVTWARQTIHVVGLNIDRANPDLARGLEGLQEFRVWRAAEIGRRLEQAGVPDALEGARRYATGAVVSRTHFAHYLVEQGRAKSVREVFRHYLRQNKPGHVSGQWASLEQAVAWIRSAGGQAVIAHPARYRLTATKLRRLIDEFVECGGEAMEVISGSHGADEVRAMAAHCRRGGLYASRGSDYHGPENPWIELGRLPELPAECVPVWDSPRWPCQISRAQAAAGA